MSSSDHWPRIDWSSFERTAPAVLSALRALGAAVDASGLEKPLTELIKIRASQLNGCAFCLQFHLDAARHLGMPVAKLDLAGVWREAGVHTPRERAALAWTEALTGMARDHIGDAAYADVRTQFSESEIAFLTSSIGAINAWNRIAGALQFAPPVPRETNAA